MMRPACASRAWKPISSAIGRGAEHVGEHAARARDAAGRGAARAAAARWRARPAAAARSRTAAACRSRTTSRAGIHVGDGRSVATTDASSDTSSCWPAQRDDDARPRTRRTPSTRNCTTKSASVCADARAEAAEHRGGVEMPAQVARRRERDRDRGEQHGDQRREPEELLRALERLPHFGPQVAHGLQPLPRLQLVAEPRPVALERAASAARSATSRRHVARLPGCSRLVAGTSSMLSSSFGPSANTMPATSGSCCTIAPSPSASPRPPRACRRSSTPSRSREPRVGPRLAARRDALSRARLRDSPGRPARSRRAADSPRRRPSRR